MEQEIREQQTIREEQTEEPSFELTPEQATGFGGAQSPDGAAAGVFNRKKVMLTLCIAFAAVIGGGLIFNINRGNKKPDAASDAAAQAARPPREFLQSQLNRAVRQGERSGQEGEPDAAGRSPDDMPPAPNTIPADPAAYYSGNPASVLAPVSVYGGNQAPPPPAPSSRQAETGNARTPAADPLLAAYTSSLVPRIEGRLFTAPPQDLPYGSSAAPGASEYLRQVLAAQGAEAALPQAPAAPADPYRTQNAQDDKIAFYSQNDHPPDGSFIGQNALWIGTVIPGILITGINTGLPGEVIARVTNNIYDSRTGEKLLIPQGTLMIASYNSGVSYAQRRVQIVWDTLIRPDGFMLDLGGMNGVDKKGFSGQEAVYHENWFEYLKAAGIISMFSVANARMAEEAAKHASESQAAAVAQSNAEFVNQMGGNIVSRAMNVQPTLTVDSGQIINIMLNKNIYIPPVNNPPVTGKYTLR